MENSDNTQESSPQIILRELKPFNIKGGCLIDGFPYAGLSNAIAAQSMIKTMNFEMVGILDSEFFPPISVVKDTLPQFPTGIFVNEDLKVAVFSSYFTPDESLHRTLAKMMINWAEVHKCSLILSSSIIKTEMENEIVVGIGSTENARKMLKKANLSVLSNGTVAGIPSILLNEGVFSDIDVIVLLINTREGQPDFRTGAEVCMAMSRLVPHAVCDLDSLLWEAEKIEDGMKKVVAQVKPQRHTMYG